MAAQVIRKAWAARRSPIPAAYRRRPGSASSFGIWQSAFGIRAAWPAVILLIAGCQAPLPPLEITPRSAWTDVPPKAELLHAHTPERLTIHHAGMHDDGQRSGEEKMRALLKFSLNERPWGDVPYHFVIVRDGRVFAARDLMLAPDTNTGYDTRGHIGICVNGDLTKQPLLEAQYRSLVDLVVRLTSELKIPDERIAGHMDYSPGKTECPGVLEDFIRDGRLLADVRTRRAGREFAFTPPPVPQSQPASTPN